MAVVAFIENCFYRGPLPNIKWFFVPIKIIEDYVPQIEFWGGWMWQALYRIAR